MKVLVIGSEGMVGRHLVYALRRRGHKVMGIDKKRDSREDITKSEINFVNSIPDVIVHLAATCSTTKGLEKPEEAFNDNTFGCLRVAECARKYSIPVIYTSSIKAVANDQGQRTPYGLTKWMGEEIFNEWKLTYGVRSIINRPGTIYGPFQDASAESGWLGWFIKASVEQRPVTIYGDGKQVRDALFVDDYVKLLIDQVENFINFERLGEIFEVGGGEDNAISIMETVKYLGLDYDLSAARPGDAQRYVSTNGFVSRPTDWRPVVGWREGIEITKEYFKRRAGL